MIVNRVLCDLHLLESVESYLLFSLLIWLQF